MWNEMLVKIWAVIEPSVIGLVGVLIITALSALVTAVRTWAAGLKDARYAAIVQRLVAAAEQKLDVVTGEDKYEWVASELGKLGMKTDDAHIEAAVHDLNVMKGLTDCNVNIPPVQ